MADENDVFNMISGSNGIMGVCDTIFIIYKKKRQDENAVLFMTGRDIRQQDVVVHFDETKYRWDMVGTAEEEEDYIRNNDTQTLIKNSVDFVYQNKKISPIYKNQGYIKFATAFIYYKYINEVIYE